MVRLILILILLVLVYWAGRSLWQDLQRLKRRSPGPWSHDSASKGGDSNLPVADVLVQDPVCGVYCPKKKALTAIYKGKVYYFCSEECRQKFLRDKVASP